MGGWYGLLQRSAELLALLPLLRIMCSPEQNRPFGSKRLSKCQEFQEPQFRNKADVLTAVYTVEEIQTCLVDKTVVRKVLHWDRIVLLTRAVRWLTTNSPTPYLRP